LEIFKSRIPNIGRPILTEAAEKEELKQRRVLAESLCQDSRWTGNKFFQKFLKEAQLQGNVADETPSVAATLEIMNQILMGFVGYYPLDFARVYTTDKAEFKVPIGEYGTASLISGANPSLFTGGGFSDSPKTVTYVDFVLDQEFGDQVTWTRAHLEDATWDVMAEQNEGAGYAMKKYIVQKMLTDMETNGTKAGAVDLSDWSELTAFLGSVDMAGYGPADYCLVNPTDYWTLLGLDQFVNSLYAGTDEVMRTGVARTMLGVTFIKVTGCTNPIVLNSMKGIGLVYRRNLTVEPFLYPDKNEYGFICSMRATEKILNPLAVQIAVA
jgi:hypothetical protein